MNVAMFFFQKLSPRLLLVGMKFKWKRLNPRNLSWGYVFYFARDFYVKSIQIRNRTRPNIELTVLFKYETLL